MTPALRVPAFRRLTVAWSFSNFGDSALYLTLAIWMKDLTGSDAAAGLVFLFLGLPAFLAPFAGHLADRFPRRRLVVIANLAAAGLVGLLALVDSSGDRWIVYAVTFGYGLLSYVTSACASGLIRDLVADDDLAGANGLLQTIDQGLRLLSPLAGAAVYATFGGVAIAALTAAMLVVSAGIVATVRMTESGPTPAAERDGFWPEVTAGLRHLRRTPLLGRLTLVLAVVVGITGIANSTTFAVIDEGLGRDSSFFGLIASLQGAGAIAGGLTAAAIISRLGERATLTVGVGLLGLGLGTMMIDSATVVLVGSVVTGVAIPWCFVSFATLRHRLTPAPLQGRVSAASALAINGPQTFGTLAGAALIGVVDYRLLLAVMTLVILACAGSLRTAAQQTAEQIADPVPTAPTTTEQAAQQVADPTA